jgi:transglutaminase-like putative cysteine protease
VQSVGVRDERTARVTVRVDGDRVIERHDEPVEAQRRASLMVTSDDPEVKRLAREAVGALGDDRAARAEAMRRSVHRHIRKKTLGVGFASAAEVARTAAGDCTEHAVLLAAMLRADGVPSRVVSGLVYAEEFEGAADVFGYHMWTQAWIDDGWLDLDPTLPDGVAFDATHIALATSNLDDAETINSLVSLVPLLGKLNIDVQRTEY